MKSYHSWDEFQWEEEIRRHEYNVAEFFKDLVYCLDLPVGDLPAPPGAAGAPAPADSVAAARSEAYMQWMLEHDEQDDGESSPADYEPRHPVCFSCVDALNQLAVQWNQFTVTHCRGELFDFALGINCAFGKLLARCADFTEPGEKVCNEALLISLGKRAVNELDDLTSRLDFIASILPEQQSEFRFFRSRLALLHDQLTGKLNELRNANA